MLPLKKSKRDWRDLNARPSASDWCEFPHSLDYSFTLDRGIRSAQAPSCFGARREGGSILSGSSGSTPEIECNPHSCPEVATLLQVRVAWGRS